VGVDVNLLFECVSITMKKLHEPRAFSFHLAVPGAKKKGKTPRTAKTRRKRSSPPLIIYSSWSTSTYLRHSLCSPDATLSFMSVKWTLSLHDTTLALILPTNAIQDLGLTGQPTSPPQTQHQALPACSSAAQT
jgi:hypothetical protein